MRITLGIVILTIFEYLFCWTFYQMIKEIKQFRKEDKLFDKATKYIDRWHRHAGIIPTPHTIQKYNPEIPKEIVKVAYQNYVLEKGGYRKRGKSARIG